MKKSITELAFVVDRSGSMGGLESDTIGGFNATLDRHREAEGDALVTTVLFDNEIVTLHDRLPIAEVAPMTRDDYQVRGCTALLDAIGSTVEHIERVHGYLPDGYVPESTIVVITTDGYENASQKFSYEQVKRLIERKREEGWEFLFLGANIDAVGEAARIGIGADRAATYMADGEGTAVMHEAVADATIAMRACGSGFGAAPDGSWKRSIERDTRRRGFFRR